MKTILSILAVGLFAVAAQAQGRAEKKPDARQTAASSNTKDEAPKTVKEADKNFWTVRVRLSVDFSKLTYVYVVNPRPKVERDTLEAKAGMKPEGEERP